MLQALEAGDLAQASRTLAAIDAQANLPHVCNAEMLAVLRKARSLAIVRRTQFLSELRSLEARKLYHAPAVAPPPTWQFDG